MKFPGVKFTSTHWMRFVVAPLIATAFYAALRLTSPQGRIEKFLRDSPGYMPLLIFSTALIGALFNVEVNIALSKWLDRKLPWEQHPLKRVLVQLAVLCLANLIASAIITVAFFSFAPLPASFEYKLVDQVLRAGTFAILLALIIGGIELAFSFFHHWKTKSLEAEQYKFAAAEAQIEALKAQLDPHFMFNSLNTLTELVEINSSKSLDFLKSFGQIYRYVLQTRAHESVTLREELDFADAYLFLIKTRFGAALQVKKNIEEADLEKHLPPMTLQLLLENAVKHNVLTISKPLYVRLSTDGEWLSVQNNLQLKSSKPYSSGIGLKNITERILRLTQQEPVIENGDVFFTVNIPLRK